MLNHAEPMCVFMFHFPARPLWPHQFPGSIGAFGPFCSPWFDVHPSDEKESLEFAVCTTRPLTTSAPQTKMSCYVNTWIFDWNILKYHTSATRITIYRLSIYHYLSLQFSLSKYIYVCVQHSSIFICILMNLCVCLIGSFNRSPRNLFWIESQSHRMEFESYWFLMNHDGPWRISKKILHISPVFTFQTLQSMRIRAKQLRSGIPTHRPWCLRNAFEMPSNAIACHRFYIQDVSMWIDQQGTQAHCITIRLLSKNAALPLHTLYFRVNSL